MNAEIEQSSQCLQVLQRHQYRDILKSVSGKDVRMVVGIQDGSDSRSTVGRGNGTLVASGWKDNQ
jgi:hypothetical protein